MTESTSRRHFLKKGAATAAGVMTAASASRVWGANDRVRLGFIGVANRGGQLIRAAMKSQDVEAAAFCDVDEKPILKQKEKVGGEVKTYNDFRRMLDRDDIDAVVIATPDHWHAIQTIEACQAGKEVYVEKPLSMTILEGRKMVEAADRAGRIVQVGLQRRSSPMYREIHDLVRSGEIGKVTVARCYRLSNMYPDGIGRAPDSEPPPDLDWEMWLGPRAARPFKENIHPYKFRWWKSYSSQMGNWGVHYFDLIRWMLDEEAPESVSTHGGRYAVDDDRTIPDTMEAVFEFKSGRLLIFGQYEACGNRVLKSGEIELRGTKGTLYAGGRGYEIVPERGGQFQDPSPRMDPVEVEHERHDLDALHMRNFLDSIKNRESPNASVEVGHRSTTFSHLGNISLETRSRIEWDPERERITSPESANDLLHYEYRNPWSLA